MVFCLLSPWADCWTRFLQHKRALFEVHFHDLRCFWTQPPFYTIWVLFISFFLVFEDAFGFHWFHYSYLKIVIFTFSDTTSYFSSLMSLWIEIFVKLKDRRRDEELAVWKPWWASCSWEKSTSSHFLSYSIKYCHRVLEWSSAVLWPEFEIWLHHALIVWTPQITLLCLHFFIC